LSNMCRLNHTARALDLRPFHRLPGLNQSGISRTALEGMFCFMHFGHINPRIRLSIFGFDIECRIQSS
jgi:hypothetical protein